MLASCRKAAWRALACNPGDAGRPFDPADSLNVGNRASNLGSPTGCSGSSLCENECRTGSAEKSTRQNGPGSTIVASPRVGGPPKLLVARVFTQARPEGELARQSLAAGKRSLIPTLGMSSHTKVGWRYPFGALGYRPPDHSACKQAPLLGEQRSHSTVSPPSNL